MMLQSVISTWIYTRQRISLPLELQVDDSSIIPFPREFIHKWINFFPESLAISPQMKKVKMQVVSMMT